MIQAAVVLWLLAIGASPGFAQRPLRLDERWTVTINGQTAPVLPDGSFRVSNIPVTDFIDLDDPAGGPDDLSDEYYQAIATAVINGQTWYASSEPFRLGRETHTIEDMTIRRTLAHAVPESIRVVTEPSLGDEDKLIIAARTTPPAQSFRRQLSTLEEKRDRLLNMRLEDQLDQETYARKHTEIRDRMASLNLQLNVLSRSADETAELALKVLELAQTLRDKWVSADHAAKRRILDIVCLNRVLDGATLVPALR